MVTQLQLFSKSLPARPLATDDFSHGLYHLEKARAIEKRYIQANPDSAIYWLTFDVDRPGAAYDWQDLKAPAPTIAVENPVNRHAHLLYGLGLAVSKAPEASLKALRFAAAVENGLRARLDGDYSYSGLTVKNPLCNYWTVTTWQDEAYDLPWLADYVDLKPYQDKRRHLPDYGLGRNCTLFENLRRWAYRAIRKLDWPSWDTWQAACFQQAAEYNSFPAPLPFCEVKSTARSIAKWTWQHFNPATFSAIQRARIQKRWAGQAQERRQLLLEFTAQLPNGLSTRQIARMANIPETTARRLLAQKGQEAREEKAQRQDF
jgi:hypothetical protein